MKKKSAALIQLPDVKKFPKVECVPLFFKIGFMMSKQIHVNSLGIAAVILEDLILKPNAKLANVNAKLDTPQNFFPFRTSAL